MAASLKSPADFMKPLKERNGKPYRLLKPSALTVSAKPGFTVPDASSELATAKQKIEQLTKENESLKTQARSPPSKQHAQEREVQTKDQAPVTVRLVPSQGTQTHPAYDQPHSAVQAPMPCHHGTPHPQPHPLSHPQPHPKPLPGPDPIHLLELQRQMEAVVSRQAADLARLKTELRTQEAHHAAELVRTRGRGNEVRAELEQEVLHLKKALKNAEDEYNRKSKDMMESHRGDVAKLSEDALRSAGDFQRIREESDRRLAELSGQLSREKQSNEEKTQQLETDLREKEKAVVSLTGQVAQLKAYIGDSLPSSKTTAQWEVEKKAYDRKLQMLQQEDENSKKTVDMLNVRLAALNEILSIQEAEMTKVSSLPNHRYLKTPGSLLLTRWREKVFALLVQRKSLEIVTQRDKVAHQEKLSAVEGQLEGALNRIRLLEHTLSDKEAQLELEKKNVKCVEQELVSVQEVANMLDSKLQESQKCLCRLRDSAARCHKVSRGLEIHQQQAAERMSLYEQRLTFATSRMELLKDLLVRRDAMQRLGRGSSKGDGNMESSTQTEGCVSDRAVQPEVSAEIQRLKRERDSLASRLKEDSTLVEQRLLDLRQEMSQAIRKSEEKMGKLQLELEKKSSSVETLEEELQAKSQSLTEAREELVTVRTHLARTQLVAEGAADEKCKILESQHTERLAEMEQRLNDARREHAKAVVSLRQLERQSARERERSKEALASQEEYLTRETFKLQTKLSEVEADRNLLMVTLRQEGLLGNYRARETGKSSHLGNSESASAESDNAENAAQPREAATGGRKQCHFTSTQKGGREPLHAVLEDLHNIAAKVLEDEDEDEDEDEEG
ncbi:coiled-coil alpha-helical rod protein 1-like [Diadema antillarum]|uniref:coiled-coil alpha-helical rod protein 1-like n=1 Tax=Diadema antillarum TaxID=105358 RepID=UPI003A8A6F68